MWNQMLSVLARMLRSSSKEFSHYSVWYWEGQWNKEHRIWE